MEQLADIGKFLAALLAGLLFLWVYLGSIYLAARDAQARGKPFWLVFLLVWLTWPLGLFAWMVFRPENVDS